MLQWWLIRQNRNWFPIHMSAKRCIVFRSQNNNGFHDLSKSVSHNLDKRLDAATTSSSSIWKARLLTEIGSHAVGRILRKRNSHWYISTAEQQRLDHRALLELHEGNRLHICMRHHIRYIRLDWSLETRFERSFVFPPFYEELSIAPERVNGWNFDPSDLIVDEVFDIFDQ